MAKKLQLRGGTTSAHGSFTGSVREVTVDTDLKTLRVHDGSTAGGERLAKFSEIASGSIANVVEDTTPQLGGALDAQSNNITSLGTVNTHTIPGGTGTFALTSDITFTASSTDTLTNKSGNISMFTNDSGFLANVVSDTTPQLGGTLDANGNTVDMNGNELILDVDGDSSITADTDDQIDIKVGNSDVLSVTSTALIPATNDAYDLGSSSKVFRDVYTGDLNLNNTHTRKNEVDGTSGSWTIQEGSNNLFLINRNNGKKYKFKLEEV